MFGDFRQLSLFKNLPLYGDTFTDEISMHGNWIFNTFKFFKELTKSFSQSNDSPDFVNLLDRLATGLLTENDCNKIFSRR